MRERNKKKSLLFKVSISLLSLLLIILLIGFGTFYSLFNKVEKVKIDKTKLNINTEEIKKLTDNKDIKSIKNIAFFGIDSEDGTTGRSDAIMIATIDSANKNLKLTSIMRDSYVNIPEHGMDKINHAYAFGGPELALQTLNTNFGLNIEDFVAVNFSSLPIIIDLLDGVEIQITEEEVPHIPGIEAAGTYNLTGEQALSYSRIRYATGGDFKRTERQRTVLNGLFKKFAQLSITSYPEIISTVLPYTKTNLSSTDVLSLATKAATLIDNGLQQERFPRDEDGKGIMIDNIYYLSFDIEKVKSQMIEYIFQ